LKALVIAGCRLVGGGYLLDDPQHERLNVLDREGKGAGLVYPWQGQWGVFCRLEQGEADDEGYFAPRAEWYGLGGYGLLIGGLGERFTSLGIAQRAVEVRYRKMIRSLLKTHAPVPAEWEYGDSGVLWERSVVTRRSLAFVEVMRACGVQLGLGRLCLIRDEQIDYALEPRAARGERARLHLLLLTSEAALEPGGWRARPRHGEATTPVRCHPADAMMDVQAHVCEVFQRGWRAFAQELSVDSS
jgi:hypothetical protein